MLQDSSASWFSGLFGLKTKLDGLQAKFDKMQTSFSTLWAKINTPAMTEAVTDLKTAWEKVVDTGNQAYRDVRQEAQPAIDHGWTIGERALNFVWTVLGERPLVAAVVPPATDSDGIDKGPERGDLPDDKTPETTPLVPASVDNAEVDAEKDKIPETTPLAPASVDNAEVDGEEVDTTETTPLVPASVDNAEVDGEEVDTTEPTPFVPASVDNAEVDGEKDKIPETTPFAPASVDNAEVDGEEVDTTEPTPLVPASVDNAEVDGEKDKIPEPTPLAPASVDNAEVDGEEVDTTEPTPFVPASVDNAEVDGGSGFFGGWLNFGSGNRDKRAVTENADSSDETKPGKADGVVDGPTANTGASEAPVSAAVAAESAGLNLVEQEPASGKYTYADTGSNWL